MQHTEAVLSVLEMVRETANENRPLTHEEYVRGLYAKAAVAEYIAANDEYDSALSEYLIRPELLSIPEYFDRRNRFKTAEKRRALAHARMKGEAK